MALWSSIAREQEETEANWGRMLEDLESIEEVTMIHLGESSTNLH
ncbi:hypothetical protein [Halomonas cupida]